MTSGSSSAKATRSSSFRSRKDFGPGKVVFFGDSFVRMFGLIEHASLRVHAFKGASAKGLGRQQNENRRKITEIVQRAPAERLVFLFGSVDIHLSYYYKKYTLKEGEIDIVEIANNYVDFVASLPVQAHATRTIVGIYPSPLEDDVVALSLASMGSITEDLISTVGASDDSKLDARQERVQRFNQALKKQCQRCSLDYIDAFDDVLDPQKNTVKDIYRDVSDYNIHIVWETTMLMVSSLSYCMPTHHETTEVVRKMALAEGLHCTRL